MNGPFLFTITDLARFLGKSPVTIRGWERKGLLLLPRDANGDRKLNTEDLRRASKEVFKLRRISHDRLRMIEAIVTLMQVVEKENDVQDRTKRSTRIGEVGDGSTPEERDRAP